MRRQEYHRRVRKLLGRSFFTPTIVSCCANSRTARIFCILEVNVNDADKGKGRERIGQQDCSGTSGRAYPRHLGYNVGANGLGFSKSFLQLRNIDQPSSKPFGKEMQLSHGHMLVKTYKISPRGQIPFQ